MTEIFVAVLNNAWITSVLMILILFGRKIFRQMPKGIYAVMWGILGLKLMIPFEIKSPFGLLSKEKTIERAAVGNAPIIVRTGIPLVDVRVNKYMETTQSSVVAGLTHMDLLKISAFLWMAGIVILFSYMLISYLIVKKKVAESILMETNVSICDEISCPFLMGILRPHIYLPSGMNKNLYEYVIAHEKMHIKHKDFIWKPIGFILLSIYWFNPLCWICYLLFCKDVELFCDESVTREKEAIWRADYCQALLACSTEGRSVWMMPLAFGEVSVKERVMKVMQYKKTKISMVVGAVIVIVVFAICFGTSRQPKKESMLSATESSSMDNPMDDHTEADNTEIDSSLAEEEISVGTVPTVDLNASTGADGAKLYYADDEKIIFGGYFGLFVYDTKNHKYIQSLDIAAIGYDATQGDGFCEIRVKKDGSEIYLHKMISSANMLVYHVEDNTFDSRPPVLNEEELYHSESEGSYDSIAIYISEETGEEESCWLINSNKTLGELGYRYPSKSDKVYPLFRDERFADAEYLRADEITDLVRAEITVNGQLFVCTEQEVLSQIADGLSKGQKMNDLSGCPFDDVLYLTKSDGTTGMMVPSMDSCKVGIFEDGIYDLKRSLPMSIDDMIRSGLFQEIGMEISNIGQIGANGSLLSAEQSDGMEITIYEAKADVTHDGILDRICVCGQPEEMTSPENDSKELGWVNHTPYPFYVKVYRGISEDAYEDEPRFISREFHLSHATNGNISLTKANGKDYLLIGNTYEMQGTATYDYYLFYLDDQVGIVVEDSKSCEFAIDEESHEDWEYLLHREDCLPEFRKSIEPYLSDAQLLLAAEAGFDMKISNENEILATKDFYNLIWKRTY